MVAIKDMDMPSCCAKCDFKEDYCFYCNKLQKGIPQSNFFDSRLPGCPLVEIDTCKDCAIKQLDKSESAEVDTEKYYCHIVSKYVDETPSFYCKYFKKRGSEND